MPADDDEDHVVHDGLKDRETSSQNLEPNRGSSTPRSNHQYRNRRGFSSDAHRNGHTQHNPKSTSMELHHSYYRPTRSNHDYEEQYYDAQYDHNQAYDGYNYYPSRNTNYNRNGQNGSSSSQYYRRDQNNSPGTYRRKDDNKAPTHNYPRYPSKKKNQDKSKHNVHPSECNSLTVASNNGEENGTTSSPQATTVSKQTKSNGRLKNSKDPQPNRMGDSQAASMKYQIQENTYECMVCYDMLGPYCAIYNCYKCYNIFHLNCIRQWATSKQDSDTDQGPSKTWTCPACQTKSEEIPMRYFCFCKSVINPQFHPYTLPHSCGEKCTRKREECTHGCTDLCHPGKCLPCPAFVSVSCSCGSSSNRVKCNQKNTVIQCSKICDKELNCGIHKCQMVCHKGPCSPCGNKNALSCYCEKSISDIDCGLEKPSMINDKTGYWACDSICLRKLLCNNHDCNKRCHSGECESCETDAVSIKVCPCGKTQLEKLSPIPRTSCLDDIPTCKKACKKKLPCVDQERDHFCQYLCHMGDCPPCLDSSLIMCNCNSITEKLNCTEVPEAGLQCEHVCNKKKSCGRHRCNEKCCSEGDHICMLDCGKLLGCRVHKCAELCHKGHCMPCLMSNFSEMTCHCGRTIIEPPIPCGTLPPHCKEPCIRPHDCDHAVEHVCHNNEYCPPCPFLSNKMCMGGHAIRFNVPCHLADVSCGERCQKLLPCGLHSCNQWCHKGDCWPQGKICDLPCQNIRTECNHICGEVCHPAFLCPQTVCEMKALGTCECGRRIVEVICFKKGKNSGEKSPKMDEVIAKFKKMKLSVSQSDLSNYLSVGFVMCDENCRAQLRNQQLAEGLGLVDVPIDSLLIPQYSEYLKQESKHSPAFILQLEKEFAVMIDKYKKVNSKSDQLNSVKSIYHYFLPMNKEKRRIIHELAAIYRIESESQDQEPLRNVVAKCCWRSEIPNIILSQYHKKRLNDGAKCVPKPLSTNDRMLGDFEPNLQTLKRPDVSESSTSTSISSQLQLTDTLVLDDWEQISP